MWLEWFKYIGWFLYTNELLTINQWEGVDLDKNVTERFTSGDQIITALGFNKVRYLNTNIF